MSAVGDDKGTVLVNWLEYDVDDADFAPYAPDTTDTFYLDLPTATAELECG